MLQKEGTSGPRASNNNRAASRFPFPYTLRCHRFAFVTRRAFESRLEHAIRVAVLPVVPVPDDPPSNFKLDYVIDGILAQLKTSDTWNCGIFLIKVY